MSIGFLLEVVIQVLRAMASLSLCMKMVERYMFSILLLGSLRVLPQYCCFYK